MVKHMKAQSWNILDTVKKLVRSSKNRVMRLPEGIEWYNVIIIVLAGIGVVVNICSLVVLVRKRKHTMFYSLLKVGKLWLTLKSVSCHLIGWLMLWLSTKRSECHFNFATFRLPWARSLYCPSKNFFHANSLDIQHSERAHGKRKVAQLKRQQFLSLDSQSITRLIWTKVSYITLM